MGHMSAWHASVDLWELSFLHVVNFLFVVLHLTARFRMVQIPEMSGREVC